jgi:hypothetical protein
MFIYKSRVIPLLGISPYYVRHKRIQREDFEKKYHKQAEKVVAVQHCNIGGEYLFNHFALDGVVHIFDSDTDYWPVRKDFDIDQKSEFVWLMTRAKNADEWIEKMDKMFEAWKKDWQKRESEGKCEFYNRFFQYVDMYEFDSDLGYFMNGGKEHIDDYYKMLREKEFEEARTPERSNTPVSD